MKSVLALRLELSLPNRVGALDVASFLWAGTYRHDCLPLIAVQQKTKTWRKQTDPPSLAHTHFIHIFTPIQDPKLCRLLGWSTPCRAVLPGKYLLPRTHACLRTDAETTTFYRRQRITETSTFFLVLPRAPRWVAQDNTTQDNTIQHKCH